MIYPKPIERLVMKTPYCKPCKHLEESGRIILIKPKKKIVIEYYNRDKLKLKIEKK